MGIEGASGMGPWAFYLRRITLRDHCIRVRGDALRFSSRVGRQRQAVQERLMQPLGQPKTMIDRLL
jgi:hypothetical protein